VKIAAEQSADLIVLGTHARGRLARLILGSTAEAVLRAAPCPVLAVGHEAEEASGRASNRQAVVA